MQTTAYPSRRSLYFMPLFLLPFFLLAQLGFAQDKTIKFSESEGLIATEEAGVLEYPVLLNYPEVRGQVAYPKICRELQQEGKVVLHVLVKADGTVGGAKIAYATFEQMGKACLETLASMKFDAPLQGGHPVESWVYVPFKFHLTEF